jgi:hypothetical protein
MAQREFNKEISNYIEEKRMSEERMKDVETIKKGAESKSVDELHPKLEEGRVQIVEKEDSWVKKVFKGKPAEPAAEIAEFEAAESGMIKKSFWKRFKGWLIEDDEVPLPEKFVESMEKIEKVEEELKEEGIEDKELEKEKSNLIMRFVSRFRPERKTTALQEQIFDLEEDLKTIAKITTYVMKQLPAEQLQEYKKSRDFGTFKEILKKRNLIKERQP